jgi:hypothetical protein
MTSIDTTTLAGLACTVAKVRYTGSGFSATIVRGDETFRARVSFSHEIGPGPKNAVRAAVKAFEKCLASNNGLSREGDFTVVPGDLNSDFYVFTFVPKQFFA